MNNLYKFILKSKVLMILHLYCLLPRAYYYVSNQINTKLALCFFVLFLIVGALYFTLRMYLTLKSSLDKKHFVFDTLIAVTGIVLSTLIQTETPVTDYRIWLCYLTAIPLVIDNYRLINHYKE